MQRGEDTRMSAAPEVRVVAVRPRTVLLVLGIAVLVGVVLLLGYLAWHVLSWILIAILLAAALNPAVEAFERRGLSRLLASSLVFVLTLAVLIGIGFLVIPPLISQVADFIEAVPDFIDDITRGRGPLGFLQDDYQIVDRVREAIEKEGPAGVLGLSEPLLDVVRSVVTAVIGVITVTFLTFFMEPGRDVGWVSLPLRSHSGVRGVLHLSFRSPRVLSDTQRRWLQAVVSQCALALERSMRTRRAPCTHRSRTAVTTASRRSSGRTTPATWRSRRARSWRPGSTRWTSASVASSSCASSGR